MVLPVTLPACTDAPAATVSESLNEKGYVPPRVSAPLTMSLAPRR